MFVSFNMKIVTETPSQPILIHMYNAINLSDYFRTFPTEIWDLSTLQSENIIEDPLYGSYSTFSVLQVDKGYCQKK